MILPGSVVFQGVVGTTFDANITIYLIETPLSWQEPLLWNGSTHYPTNAAVVISTGIAYKSTKENVNVYPLEDLTGTWVKIEPFNLEGYTASMKVSKSLTLESGKGLTMGGKAGTISIEMTPTQTAEQTAASEAFSLILKQTSTGKEYEYLKGSIAWAAK